MGMSIGFNRKKQRTKRRHKIIINPVRFTYSSSIFNDEYKHIFKFIKVLRRFWKDLKVNFLSKGYELYKKGT